MERAIGETNRRRAKQVAFNKKHDITPRGVEKKIADIMEGAYASSPAASARRYAQVAEETLEYARLSPHEAEKKIEMLEKQMLEHARNLEFEEAAKLRDEIQNLKEHVFGLVQA
jgi:excinuclease ABC subunit B